MISNEKSAMVNLASKHGIAAQDWQQDLTGASVGAPSVSQLPGCPSPNIDLQTWEAVSFEFCSILLYQTYDIDYAIKFT